MDILHQKTSHYIYRKVQHCKPLVSPNRHRYFTISCLDRFLTQSVIGLDAGYTRHMFNHVRGLETGAKLNINHRLQGDGKYTLTLSLSNELGRLAQGVGKHCSVCEYVAGTKK